MVDQIGLWIANYVEPAINGPRSHQTLDLSHYIGWETFLRVDGGLHYDPLARFLFWPTLQFLTFLVYIGYLWALQEVCLSSRYHRDHSVVGGFILLHATLALFAWQAHSVPPILLTQPIAFLQCWGHGWQPVALYLIPCLLLVFASVPYVFVGNSTREVAAWADPVV
jgi:uncharacterized membrane protein